MSTYSLPRDAYELLVEALGEKQKAEVFARALERSIQAIDERADAASPSPSPCLRSPWPTPPLPRWWAGCSRNRFPASLR